MNIIGQGAEAILSMDAQGNVVKERIQKTYRIPQIDNKLRQFRTRREAKILKKIGTIGIPAPSLKEVDDKKMKITMSFAPGEILKNILQQNPEELSLEIGKKIGILHANNIIHSDLTTSNMIFDKEINFIDFGLSFFSTKIEDKAVDLHLLRQSLESKHNEIWQKSFKAALQGYKETNPEADKIIQQLEKVEKRGRNKK